MLSLDLSGVELDAVNRPNFDWKMQQPYVARLIFYSDLLEQEKTSDTPDDNKVAGRSLSSYIDTPTPNDTRFVFTRTSDQKNFSIWSSSTPLKQNCPWFETLFASDFAESKLLSDSARKEQKKVEPTEIEAETQDSEMGDDSGDDESTTEDDSDFDLDDALDESNSPSPPDPNLPYHLIKINGTPYVTYRAVLVWIQTGWISFSPLRSSFSHLPSESRKFTRVDAILSSHQADPQAPLSASPKSVYRLAHRLSLPALETLALKNLSSQLTVENIFIELFDESTVDYEEIRKVEVAFAVKNKQRVVQTKAFKNVIQKLRRNELAFSGPVMADLLPLLIG